MLEKFQGIEASRIRASMTFRRITFMTTSLSFKLFTTKCFKI